MTSKMYLLSEGSWIATLPDIMRSNSCPVAIAISNKSRKELNSAEIADLVMRRVLHKFKEGGITELDALLSSTINPSWEDVAWLLRKNES